MEGERVTEDLDDGQGKQGMKEGVLVGSILRV